MLPLKSYYAKGKLLVTGEYTVLDGALALAIPTKKGQLLEVYPTNNETLAWESFDVDGSCWFKGIFSSSLEVIHTNDIEKANTLKRILQLAIEQNLAFADELQNKKVKTILEFDRNWGLGSSSTLLHLIGQWAKVDPFKILEPTFGGSGYDIACAKANGAITFQKTTSGNQVKQVRFQPMEIEKFYFIYLGQKQISKNEIGKYSGLQFNRADLAEKVSCITKNLISTTNTSQISELLEAHEELLSQTLGYPKIKNERFPSINGTFKSLGAWGGDFVLFIGDYAELEKIKNLGYDTIISWNQMLDL